MSVGLQGLHLWLVEQRSSVNLSLTILRGQVAVVRAECHGGDPDFRVGTVQVRFDHRYLDWQWADLIYNRGMRHRSRINKSDNFDSDIACDKTLFSSVLIKIMLNMGYYTISISSIPNCIFS